MVYVSFKFNKYGSKTGSYKKTSTGYNSYDKYGSKTGSFKTNSNGVTTQYDKHGSKASFGKFGHSTVINALKRFREFVYFKISKNKK